MGGERVWSHHDQQRRKKFKSKSLKEEQELKKIEEQKLEKDQKSKVERWLKDWLLKGCEKEGNLSEMVVVGLLQESFSQEKFTKISDWLIRP